MISYMDLFKLYRKIDKVFESRPNLGKIKSIVPMRPVGNNQRYHIRCTYNRNYIVYVRDGEIFNVGVYIE